MAYKMIESITLNRTGKDAIDKLFPGILKFKETKTTYTEPSYDRPKRIEGSDDFIVKIDRTTYRKNKWTDQAIRAKTTPIRCKPEWVDVKMESNRGPAALGKLLSFG